MFGILIKMSFRPGGKVAESHFAKFPRAEKLFFRRGRFPLRRKRCFFNFLLFRPGGKVVFSSGKVSARAETLFQPFDEHAPCLYVVIRIVLFSSHYQSICVNFDISAFFKD